MRSVSFSEKSEQSLNSSDSYRENILLEFAKSVKSSTAKRFSFLKRAKSSCYQVNNRQNVSSWDIIGKTGHSIWGGDSLSFDGNSSTSSTSSQNGKDAASLGSVMTTNSSISSSPTRARSKKHVKTKPIFGRSYKTIQSEVRIEQLKSEIEALKPQTVKRLI